MKDYKDQDALVLFWRSGFHHLPLLGKAAFQKCLHTLLQLRPASFAGSGERTAHCCHGKYPLFSFWMLR